MKEQKTILAALALAFVLGAVAPSAVFASEGSAEGEDAGISAQASEAGAGVNEDEQALDVNESIAELYKRIQTQDGFEAYRNSVALIENMIAINNSSLLSDATTWAKETECHSANGVSGNVYTWLDSGTKTALSGKMVYQVLSALKSDEEYTTNDGYKVIVDNLETEYNTLRTTELEQIAVALPNITIQDNADFAGIVATVTTSTNYVKFLKMYDSMVFLQNAISDDVVSVDALEELYSDATLMANYTDMAQAAAAIDPNVTTGLAVYTLPTTSVGGNSESPTANSKPSTPDSGVVGLFENGALDLATLTLIVSVGLAGVAGLALIAKLYLKHKF